MSTRRSPHGWHRVMAFRLGATCVTVLTACTQPSSRQTGGPPGAREQPEGVADPSVTEFRFVRASNGDSYYVAYTPAPDPIPLNDLFSLRVKVFSGKDRGQRVPGVALAVDARMPEHRHGMNVLPQVEARADGSFQVNGMLFHMPGRWELYFDVTRGAVTERTQFEIEID